MFITMDVIDTCTNSENCEFNQIQNEFAMKIIEKLQKWKMSENLEIEDLENIDFEVSSFNCVTLFTFFFID